MSTDTPTEGLKRLREPFPSEQVGLLPKVTCKDCSDRNVQCQKHNRIKCSTCGAYVSEAHIHLDYVGHGAVTDRLLEVDPQWNWKPLAFDQAGMPTFVYDKNGNPVELWIELTVCGQTRLGVGTCPSGQFDAAKVLIGDALRNAAMRFGVALELWIKGHAEDDERTTSTSEASGNRARTSADQAAQAMPAKELNELRAKVREAASALSEPRYAQLVAWAKERQHPKVEQLTPKQANDTLARIEELSAEAGAWTEQQEAAKAIADGAEAAAS